VPRAHSLLSRARAAALLSSEISDSIKTVRRM
jgi:hypothetical protein